MKQSDGKGDWQGFQSMKKVHKARSLSNSLFNPFGSMFLGLYLYGIQNIEAVNTLCLEFMFPSTLIYMAIGLPPDINVLISLFWLDNHLIIYEECITLLANRGYLENRKNLMGSRNS
jgi:hypothetical protein